MAAGYDASRTSTVASGHEIYDECRARFVSEYGVIGPCRMDSVRSILKPNERARGIAGVAGAHQTFEKETTPAAIRCHYAEPEGLTVEQYILYGQMFQAMLYGRSLEALRFRKHDASRRLPGRADLDVQRCWGETGWTPIDYYLRRKPSYYRIKNAFAPIRAIVRRRANDLVTRVVNDTLEPVCASLAIGWMRVDGTDAKLEWKQVTVPVNGMCEVARETIPESLESADWIYAACFEGDLGHVIPGTWQAVPYRQLTLKTPTIRVRKRGKVLTLESDVYAHGVHVNDEGAGLLSEQLFRSSAGTAVLDTDREAGWNPRT